MMEWNALATILVGLFGTTFAGQWLFFRRQHSRLKTADAFNAEVDVLKKQIDMLSTRLDKVQSELDIKDKYIRQISAEKQVLDIKHQKNKGAINKAYACTHQGLYECPVLKHKTKNDFEYLQLISSKNEKRD